MGSCFVSLSPLLEGKPIRERLEVKKGNQRRGTIDVKIFWYEADEGKDGVGIESKPDGKAVHEELKAFMKEWNVDAEKVFRLIDDNKTGLVSFEEFETWIRQNGAKARKFPAEVISGYYRGFKEPVSLHNFVSRVSQEYTIVESERREA